MPSFFTHLDIANQCIQQTGLNKTHWLDFEHFLSGSIAPDFGYFNKKELAFTNLCHTNKNRKAIKELFKQSKTPQEVSFSLGFLSHYITDKIMERWVYWKSSRMLNRPWYMLKKPAWRTKLPQDLHHMRIEWSLDLNVISTPQGRQLTHNKIAMPNWDTNNIITKTYKKIFSLNVDYQELDKTLDSLNGLKPKILLASSLAGLKNVLEKRYYPLEKLGYHVLRKIALLVANVSPNPIYIWAFLDPYHLNKKQKKAFSRLRDRAIKKFARYTKFNPYVKKIFRPT